MVKACRWRVFELDYATVQLRLTQSAKQKCSERSHERK